MQEVIGLFPTPFMRVPGALRRDLVTGLVEHFSAIARSGEQFVANLSHTAMLRPSDSPLLVEAAALITPLLADFGALLFGERLGWSLKEMWVNVLDTGGRQAMHNHANSFISGVVYLTPTHPDARTVFMKSPGGTDFSFKNDHAGGDHGTVQRRQVDQPAARARRRRAVPELPDARGAAEPRRAAHHHVVQRDSDPPRLLGLQDLVQRLSATGHRCGVHRRCEPRVAA